MRQAVLYRMVMKSHICPYGLKARFLLKRKGYQVEDRWLTTREQTDAFKAEHDVKTTPQTFIDGDRVGGYDDLRRLFGLRVADPKETSYVPVLAVFGMALLMAMALVSNMGGELLGTMTLAWFVSLSMAILAILKLQNIEQFSTMFLGYDLLAQRCVPYAYIYPFLEAAAALLMMSGIGKWPAIVIMLFIGGVGALSVFKAVYIDKRALKCACVGGGTNVPLGAISLTENIMMIGMAVWMILS